MSIRSPFPEEVSAIRSLRVRYPDIPSRELALRIHGLDSKDQEELKLMGTASGWGKRTFYSIYAVIRRYDGNDRVKAYQVPHKAYMR